MLFSTRAHTHAHVRTHTYINGVDYSERGYTLTM